MKPVEFENGTVQVDAAIIAEGFGITLPMLQKRCKPAASQAFASAASMRTEAAIA
jgi:hypothetical protein